LKTKVRFREIEDGGKADSGWGGETSTTKVI